MWRDKSWVAWWGVPPEIQRCVMDGEGERRGRLQVGDQGWKGRLLQRAAA